MAVQTGGLERESSIMDRNGGRDFPVRAARTPDISGVLISGSKKRHSCHEAICGSAPLRSEKTEDGDVSSPLREPEHSTKSARSRMERPEELDRPDGRGLCD